MDTLIYFFIGVAGAIVGRIVENRLRKKIRSEFRCWMASIVITIALFGIVALIYRFIATAR